jgi:hypothetical protein
VGNLLNRKGMMDLRKIGFQDGRWMNLSQDHTQWQTLESVILTFGFYYQTVTWLVDLFINFVYIFCTTVYVLCLTSTQN